MLEETIMKDRSRNRMFNALLLMVGVSVFVFFIVLVALTAVILQTLTQNHSKSSDPSLQLLQREINALKLTNKWNTEETDKQLEGMLQKIRSKPQKDEPDNGIDINARKRRSVRELEVKTIPLIPLNNRGRGTLYIRWGRVNCSETSYTTTLYSGIIGISHVGHVGGGSNHLCLPFEPEYGYQQKGLQYTVGSGGSLIQGVEYRAENIYPFKNNNNGGLSINKEDAVCSVCYASTRSVSLMIPAKRSCPKDWTLEYAGYLMAANHKNHRTNYVCVDESPEGKPSGENTNGGSYLYPVEGGCGALPCPNYRDGLELTCVVCTK